MEDYYFLITYVFFMLILMFMGVFMLVNLREPRQAFYITTKDCNIDKSESDSEEKECESESDDTETAVDESTHAD